MLVSDTQGKTCTSAARYAGLLASVAVWADAARCWSAPENKGRRGMNFTMYIGANQSSYGPSWQLRGQTMGLDTTLNTATDFLLEWEF
jgi:hypothetical protein